MKKPPTCEDLYRPSLDITLNTVLLFTIVLSYLPQIYRIVSYGSTFGITGNYVLFNYLFTAMQFTTILLLSCYHYPVLECIRNRELKGLDSYGASLGLIQITAQWLGSALMAILFLLYPSITNQSLAEPVPRPSLLLRQLSHYELNQQPDRSRLIVSLCISHCLIWVLPAIWIALQSASQTSWGSYIFVGLCDMICIPVSIVLVISQFSSQIKALLAMEEILDASSLSIWTLAIQTIIFILVGISWIYRLGPRGKGFNRVPDGIVDPFTWYYISSWPYINNVIFGVGQGVLFITYLCQMLRTKPGGLHNSTGPATNERTGLLA